ncbi:MAG: hypothetical protein R6U39_09585, partial [Candidatus Aegiribacteria sp.]
MFQLFLFLSTLISTPQPVTAVRVEQAPDIDGVLDDPVWQDAVEVESTFMQFGPDYGESMSEPTYIYVIYDDSSIYFSFFLHDPNPERMVEALTPRDDYITGEWIVVLLDTWGDGREALKQPEKRHRIASAKHRRHNARTLVQQVPIPYSSDEGLLYRCFSRDRYLPLSRASSRRRP